MDLNDPITSVIPTLEGRVFQVLARTDLALSGSRVASLIPSASNAGVRTAIARLVDQGLVLSQSAPPAVLYVANRRHLMWDAIEQLMRAADSVRHRLSGIIYDVVRMELGVDEAAHTSVALYGSTARGDNRPDSDIDLLLVTRNDPAADERVDRLVSRLIGEVHGATGNETNIYPASRARLDWLVRNDDPMIASWIADARTLVGPDVGPLLKGGSWLAS
ncbi:hypothetical protein ASD16_19070 [Cellulomonas sp. Root485]|uniref:nucleotidyltransferase domain-containing protein n=1 Tax=Cellulomonas sp. Root485 TaxID=1736546 RepID=UPI0006F532C2|nr:nucleotidyltransferase domain-containing protein [Cellulomonas sp. Root485]KQY21395.1 hypothetical protein ASD16_19070 [Cellulomonas sp. Root485]